jgi:cyclase
MRTPSFVAAAAFLLPLAARAQKEPDWSKIELVATRVAGQIYVIESAPGSKGSGGNLGASVGPDGIVLIDDKFAPLAPKIQAALKTVTDKPVRFIINTHFHRDHAGGNAAFGKDATIIAHENTRKRLMEGSGDKDPPAPPVALPIITFEDKLSVHLNGEEIRAIHFPSGHTDTDVVVFFTKSNVVHMGDHYWNGIFPFIDLEGGGSVHGFVANVEKVVGQIPADAKVICGHGPAVTSVAELKAFLAMLKETTGIVEAGLKAGKTADQLKKDKVLAKYDSWGKGFIKTDDWIDTIAKDLKH